MKTYCIISQTGYGKIFHVVNAVSEKEARIIAKKAGAWNHAAIYLVDISKAGCIFDSDCQKVINLPTRIPSLVNVK